MHLFIHIPKTAGTSFRDSLESQLGPTQIACDYGIQSPRTTSVIQGFLKSKPFDSMGCVASSEKAGFGWIAGHVWAERYRYAIPSVNTLTFLREPSERLFSEYLHKKRKMDLEGPFAEYFKKRPNVQSKYLASIPLSALGFVGITEHYRDSLKLLKYLYGIDLKPRKTNKAPFFSPSLKYQPRADRARCRELNTEDYALYEQSLRLFNQRLTLMKQNLPIALGDMLAVEAHQLTGWAFWHPRFQRSEGALIVSAKINGRSIGSVEANSDLRGYEISKCSGLAHIGFSFDVDLQKGDEVTVEVIATGQRLARVVF